MMIRKILMAIFLLANTFTCIADNTGVPVMVGTDEGLDACPSLGIVYDLKTGGDGFLAVRSGANVKYKLVDKLQQRQEVSICGTSADGKWLGIVYARKKGADCGVSRSISPAQPYKGQCKSGWVSSRWIKVIAG